MKLMGDPIDLLFIVNREVKKKPALIQGG